MLAYARILIVDDSRVTRRIVRGMLEAAGHPNTDEAADGREALGLLGKRSYKLVISDWDMAPMSGLDLLGAMRASRPLRTIPFIMVTAKAQKRFSAVARDMGATHYIEKPFSAAELMGCIRTIRFDTREVA